MKRRDFLKLVGATVVVPSVALPDVRLNPNTRYLKEYVKDTFFYRGYLFGHNVICYCDHVMLVTDDCYISYMIDSEVYDDKRDAVCDRMIEEATTMA